MVDLWRFPNFVLILLLLIFISYKVYKKSELIAGIATFYASFSALFIYALSSVRYGPTFQYYMNTVAARAFTQTIVPIFALFIVKNTSIFWFLFETISHINSIAMIFGYGITNILSFNATFAAMTVPMIWFKPSKVKFPFNLIIFLPLLAISKAGGSTPIFVLIAGFVGVAIANRLWKFILPAIIIPLMAGMFFERSQLLDSNERFDRWKKFMNWWASHEFTFIGTGSGTFEWLGPIIEKRSENAYIFLHNEYLQVIFEQGVIGLLIMAGLIYTCLKKSTDTPWLFGSVCAASMAMTTQFPLRFVITQFFILLIIRECLWKKSQY